MANDNNKINDLAETSEDDPTSELESLSDERLNNPDYYDESEADDDTYDFERLEDSGALEGKSVAALQSDIRSRNESISRLQFDIEQLRSRWTGLEKEIRAREDMTVKLNEQLEETRTKLSRTEELLGQRDMDIDALQAKLKEKQALLHSVEEETQNVSRTVETGKTVISELQSTVASQQSTIKKLKREKKSSDKATTASESTIGDLQASVDELQAALDRQSDQHAQSEAEAKRLKSQLTENKDKLKRANAKIDELSTDLRKDESRELRDQQDLIARQEGLIAQNSQEITELRVQISRTEDYADRLRRQLHDLADNQGSQERKISRLQAALRNAEGQASDLAEQLESEQLASADLRKKYDETVANFDEEVRTIRFELGGAQETLADQETINEQLASDLIDHQGFRQALEQQLDATEKESKTKIRELERQLRQSDQARDDAEHKLANKDNAIAALLAELASRSRTIDSIGEMENVIHEIDGRMSERIDERSSGEKDRMARLLIGNVDGQELQFPLFKDRLTIGRTAHNDIQLKAQFISRRHALIVTENDQSRIVDWGSKNGVYVNDTRVSEQVLKNGDIVAIGTAEFRYEQRPKR